MLIPDAYGALEEGDDARDEDDGRDQSAAVRVALLHAQRRSEDERHRDRAPKHHQVVLLRHHIQKNNSFRYLINHCQHIIRNQIVRVLSFFSSFLY